jgi:pimeloyl-ACP methyl ester carboxylesterase
LKTYIAGWCDRLRSYHVKKTFLKVARIAGVVVVGLLAIAALVLIRPDISFDHLQQKYGAQADNYMQMPDGVLVHFRDEGPRGGPTLVLVHGFTASLIDWDTWAEVLTKRYRVIRLDLPGHGLTLSPAGYQVSLDHHADLIDALTTRLNAPRFVLVGNSMGGGVAWNFAIRHAGRLDGLVLEDAVGWPQPKGAPGNPSLPSNPMARAVLRNIDMKPLFGPALKSVLLDPTLVTPAMIDRYANFARAPGHRDILLLGPGAPSQTTVADLGQIKAPTLIMHGEQDKLVPFADGQAFAHAIQGAVLVAYPDVGHAPMQQIPGRSANDLDRWLRTKVWLAPAGAADPGPVAPAD